MVVQDQRRASRKVVTNEEFDRFASPPNSSLIFGGIKRVVFPRFCPPDRCSGAPPSSTSNHGINEDYEQVEQLLNLIFDNCLVAQALIKDEEKGRRSQYRRQFLSYLISFVSTIDWDSALQQSKLRVMLEDTHTAFLDTLEFELTPQVLELLEEALLEAWSMIVSFSIRIVGSRF